MKNLEQETPRNTPLVLEIMLRAYYDPNFNPDNSSAADHALIHLTRHGLLRKHPFERLYQATDRGRAWVEMICQTPYPLRQQLWIDPRTNQPVADPLHGPGLFQIPYPL